MGVLTLLRRRLRTHPLALTAVVVAALMSMVVVATLQLLSGAISDAGARSSLGAGPSGTVLADSTVSVNASITPASLPAADAVVRPRLESLADDVTVSRVAYPTARGIRGGDARARVQLADITGLQEHTDLVEGRWARRTASDSVIEVALPEQAASALGLAPGKTLVLRSLTNEADPDLTVTIVGTYRVRDHLAAIWLDDPLSPVGVSATDYTTYGPLVLAPGVFETGLVGKTQITWRGATRFQEATAASVSDVRASVTETLRQLRVDVGDNRDAAPGSAAPASAVISGGRVETGLTARLDAASLVAARIRASLLTPTVLLILLGAASLVMAARLLASLRAEETRLMRTRGMSTSQVALLACADSGLIVGTGAVGALVLAPLLTRAIGRAAEVELSAGTYTDALRNGQLWVALVTMALLATLVVVVTSARSGTSTDPGRGPSGAGGRTPAALQFASGSGLDLALVGIGVLAVLQLRRYDVAGSTTVDPLTIAAPACVIAGLAVLCLRLLPGATRQVERVSVSHVGLDRAWGAWQLSRRLAAQGGTILLILLCVAMGGLALAHVATANRALADQSAFETGAPVRIDTMVGRVLAEQAAGGAARAMPVLRESEDLRTVEGFTVLGVDASRAGRIVEPRPDTLAGGTWPELMTALARERPTPATVALPADTKALTFRIRIVARAGDADFIRTLSGTGQLLLRDGRGMVTSVAAGQITRVSTATQIDLPQGDLALAEPVSIIGFSTTPFGLGDLGPTNIVLGLEVTDLRADGRTVAGTDQLTDQSQSADLRLTTAASKATHLPVVMTRALAAALDVRVGGTLTLPIRGRSVPARVTGLMDSVPTAADPTSAVLFDLPTLYATTDRPGVDQGWPTIVPPPREWWLAPSDSAAAAKELRGVGVRPDAVVVRAEVEASRRTNPVNAGMQGAMLLVTGAALVLAAVGFAATTASLARTRHHENAILLALGMPPARIRRVLTLERISVVVLTVLVGVAMGAAAAYVVVPYLVGGDGHAQVPEVLVVIPWGRIALLAGAVTAVLSAIGVLVLRRTGSDLATELRMGESR
ncbi:putative membrane protein [Janibacter sp. HTCC2649]|uniref:FtsX-like permease family protein n=1 Tax=Janibacter sp. HTCC2649 TaxID=313589 RepID=UPI0000670B7F|nr:FtsX-like permease family protein [Janibacter sp. HTCC2649]EAP99705.1 putative membrane protein [Janibacter sp. HTCC2649]